MSARCGAGRYATMANTLTGIYCHTLQGPVFLHCKTGSYIVFPHRHHMQPEMPGCSRALLLLLLLRGVNIQIKYGEDLRPKVEADQAGGLYSKVVLSGKKLDKVGKTYHPGVQLLGGRRRSRSGQR